MLRYGSFSSIKNQKACPTQWSSLTCPRAGDSPAKPTQWFLGEMRSQGSYGFPLACICVGPGLVPRKPSVPGNKRCSDPSPSRSVPGTQCRLTSRLPLGLASSFTRVIFTELGLWDPEESWSGCQTITHTYIRPMIHAELKKP